MPESVPLVHVLFWEVQVLPYATVDARYAVTEALWATDCPLNVQAAGEPTVHALLVYVPDSVPFEHVRDCDVHVEPYGTVAAWYAVTDAP